MNFAVVSALPKRLRGETRTVLCQETCYKGKSNYRFPSCHPTRVLVYNGTKRNTCLVVIMSLRSIVYSKYVELAIDLLKMDGIVELWLTQRL